MSKLHQILNILFGVFVGVLLCAAFAILASVKSGWDLGGASLVPHVEHLTFLVSIIGLIGLWATIRAAYDIFRLETQPILSVELVDGEAYRLDDFGSPLFMRVISGGRSGAFVTKSVRQWAFVSEPQNLLPADPDGPREDGPYTRTTDHMFLVGPNGSSPPISTFADQMGLDAYRSRVDEGTENRLIYFHGLIEFTDAAGTQKGRTGYCFVFDPATHLRGRGFHVAPLKKLWYYDKLR